MFLLKNGTPGTPGYKRSRVGRHRTKLLLKKLTHLLSDLPLRSATVIADGLNDASFDVTDTGEYLTAAEINEYVDDPDAVIVDMRNNYESEVGQFENAITPDVVTFRDELKKMPELLRVHKKKLLSTVPEAFGAKAVMVKA